VERWGVLERFGAGRCGRGRTRFYSGIGLGGPQWSAVPAIVRVGEITKKEDESICKINGEDNTPDRGPSRTGTRWNAMERVPCHCFSSSNTYKKGKYRANTYI